MKHTTAFRLMLFVLLLTAGDVHAVTLYWVRSTPGNWNQPNSWSPTSGGAPVLTNPSAMGDVAIFDGGGVGNCFITSTVDIFSTTINATYPGTITNTGYMHSNAISFSIAGGTYTLAAGSLPNIGTFTQTGGTFNGANVVVQVLGNFTKTGGTFNAPSGILEVRGNFTVGASQFNHNNGTVYFAATTPAITINIVAPLANVNFFGFATATYNITGTLIVNGTLRHQGAGGLVINGGNINCNGNVLLTNTSTAGGGSANLRLTGTGIQQINSSVPIGQSRVPHIVVAKTAGTFGFVGTVTVTGNFLYDPPGATGCVSAHAAGAVLAMSGNATLTTVDLSSTYSIFTLCNLTLMTGCYVQLGSYIQIRNILFQPLSQLDATTSNHWINMYGTWINQSTSASSFNERAGRVTMGSGSLTSSVTGGESFYELEMVDPAGSAQLTINSRVNIISTLRDVTVTNYNIIYNSTTAPLVFLDNATMWYSDPGMMTLAVTGPVTKIGNDAFSFPVGAVASPFIYSRPITISAPAQTTDQFTAQYYLSNSNALYSHASRDISIQTMSDCEYWTLNRTAGFSSVFVTLSFWATATPQCPVINPTDVIVCRWDGTTWKNHGQSSNTFSPPSFGTVTSLAPINSFSPFTIGSTTMSNPLPVELTSFLVQPEMSHVNVQWSTATETNNDYFIIEKSTDGSTVQSVDTIDGNGTTSTTHEYSLTDYTPFDGQSYYRLTQVDFNGHTTSYDWQPVTITAVPEVHCYPNPSQGELHVELPGEVDEYWTMTVTDLNGKVVWFREGQRDVFGTVHMALPAGAYAIMMSSETVNYRQRLVITD